MKRKVSQIGPSTLMVSLPSKWARKFGVKKGDEMDAAEDGSRIMYYADTQISIKSKEIHIEKVSPFITRILASIYKNGYDEIRIKYDKKEIFDIIQRSIRDYFIDLEIMEQTESYCLVKSIADLSKEKFDPTLRRAFLVSLNMADSVLELLKKGETKELSSLITLEQTNNRLTSFCRKLLVTKGYKDNFKLPFIYCLVEELEKLTDEYKYICLHFAKYNSLSVDEKYIDLLEQTNNIFREYYKLYFDFNLKKAEELYSKVKKIIDQSFEYLEKDKKHYYFYNIISVAQKISNLLSFLMSLEA